MARGNRIRVTLAAFLKAVNRARHKFDPPSTHADRFFQKEIPMVRFDIPKRLAMPSYFNGSSDFKHRSKANWVNVDPYVIEFSMRFIETMRQRQIPLYAHSAFRTRQEQTDLKARGVSRASYPRAPHCQGRAVDLVHGRYHWELTPVEWKTLGLIGKDVNRTMNAARKKEDQRLMIWGGDWKFYDPAHWELEKWWEDIRTFPDQSRVELNPRGYLRR